MAGATVLGTYGTHVLERTAAGTLAVFTESGGTASTAPVTGLPDGVTVTAAGGDDRAALLTYRDTDGERLALRRRRRQR